MHKLTRSIQLCSRNRHNTESNGPMAEYTFKIRSGLGTWYGLVLGHYIIPQFTISNRSCQGSKWPSPLTLAQQMQAQSASISVSQIKSSSKFNPLHINHTGHTVRTGYVPSKKAAVGVNVLTVDQQLRNGLFSLCKMCDSNSFQKAALCSCLLGTLSALWRFWCRFVMTCILWFLLNVQN